MEIKNDNVVKSSSTTLIINGKTLEYDADGKLVIKTDTPAMEPNTLAATPKCKRATILHTETCGYNDETYSCSEAGYTSSGSKGTTTITYGNLGTQGTLNSGDAFDCDVNGDGTYDAEKERFYYVSPRDGDNTSEYVTLIYYNNVFNHVAYSQYYEIKYDNSNENLHGPRAAMLELPTPTQWPNVYLSKEIRANYSGYVARLLTAREVNIACNITVGSEVIGELDKCNYLLENTEFANNNNEYLNAPGYWLETPSLTLIYYALLVNPGGRNICLSSFDTTFSKVRPAIEVKKTDIEY